MTELDLHATLSLGFDNLQKELRATREAAVRIPPQPREMALVNSAAFPSSGVLAFDMGGPQQGSVWQVRSIDVGGLTPTTTAAGRCDVFVASTALQVVDGVAAGSQPGGGGFIFGTGLAAGSLGRWRDQALTLPKVAFYSVGDLAVHAQERLYVVFSSGTNTQVLMANVRVDEYETAAYRITREG